MHRPHPQIPLKNTQTKHSICSTNGKRYRYGFNGKEKDNETYGEGNVYDFGARIYDSRLGRWLSLDPLAIKYPFMSPYHFANNNPISFIDYNGFDGIQPRDIFYEKMGTAIINTLNNLDIGDKANTFKALYIVCQYRMENKFNLNPPGNNPFNIKGFGDLGQITLKTTEYINGKRVKIDQKFANFSTLEKGFEGYMQLLKNNFSTAYDKLFDNTKTIMDFAKSMQTEGRLGVFATDPEYQAKFKTMLKGVVADYEKMLDNQIDKKKSEVDRLHSLIKDQNVKLQESLGLDPSVISTLNFLKEKLKSTEEEIENINKQKEELNEFKENEGLQ